LSLYAGYMPVHSSYSDAELFEMISKKGCNIKCRQECIKRETDNKCQTDYIYDVGKSTLATTECGVLAQIGTGKGARIVKFFIFVVKIVGDIVGLNVCSNCGYARSKMPCRICCTTDIWDFESCLESDNKEEVPLRDSVETQKAGEMMSIILEKLFDNDCANTGSKLSKEEEHWKEIAETKDISTLRNQIYKLFRPLCDAGIHTYHEGLGPELLHTLKLGALKHVPGTVASLVQIFVDIEKEILKPRNLRYKNSLSIFDRRLKNAPIAPALQTFFPVRQTRIRKSLSSMTHSKATNKTNSAYFSGSLYGWEYEMFSLMMMFILACDVNNDILPGLNDDDVYSTTIPGSGGIRSCDIKTVCVKAIASIVEVLAYLQKDEFSDIDVDCLNILIANFRLNNFMLLQMKKDLNAVLDDNKRKKRGNSVADAHHQPMTSAEESLSNLNIFGDPVVLSIFSNKEIKPHYLQHIPAEIKLISAHRHIRDTELLEHFIGHGGLKDLWSKISKRYGTDKIELLKKYLSVKHADELYFASKNRWSAEQMWRRIVEKTSDPSNSDKKDKEGLITDSNHFSKILFQYLPKGEKPNRNPLLESAIHPVLRQDDLQRNLDVFFGDRNMRDKFVRAYSMFTRWKTDHGSTKCSLCKGLKLSSRKGVFKENECIIRADRNYPLSYATSNQHEITVPAFSVMEAEVYDSITATSSVHVVRILAIVQFRRLNAALHSNEVYDEEILCVVAPMKIDPKPHRSQIPFDVYQYQRDPNGDNQMMHITCCHVSALLRPVFCIARNWTDIGNQATSMVFGESNKKRQQFYIITLNRWHPRLEEGRKYDSFYSDKQTNNKNSWAAFHKEAVIKEYRSSLLRTIQK